MAFPKLWQLWTPNRQCHGSPLYKIRPETLTQIYCRGRAAAVPQPEIFVDVDGRETSSRISMIL